MEDFENVVTEIECFDDDSDVQNDVNVYAPCEDDEETEDTTEVTGAKWNLRERLKSKVLWVSAISEIVIILNGIYNIVEGGWDGNEIETILVAILGVLSLFGIFNDPTTKGAF